MAQETPSKLRTLILLTLTPTIRESFEMSDYRCEKFITVPFLSVTHCDPFLAYPAYFRGDEIWQFSPYRGLNAIKPRFDRYSCGFFMSADFP